jgi:hypothetical protein
MTKDESSKNEASGEPHSRLFYHGTTTEVCLGDQIKIRRWFRKVDGTVCYIPGISPPHPTIDYENVRQWGIKLRNGTVLVSGYYPERAQPRKHIRFVARSEQSGLSPDTPLE